MGHYVPAMAVIEEVSPYGLGVGAWEVFLGGSCGTTTWRQTQCIPRLGDVTYYNPQIDAGCWHEGLIATEAKAKETAVVTLFVIDGATRAAASMVELMVLVVEDVPEGAVIDGEVVTEKERRDLNRGRAYLLDLMRQREATTGHTNGVVCAS